MIRWDRRPQPADAVLGLAQDTNIWPAFNLLERPVRHYPFTPMDVNIGPMMFWTLSLHAWRPEYETAELILEDGASAGWVVLVENKMKAKQ